MEGEEEEEPIEGFEIKDEEDPERYYKEEEDEEEDEEERDYKEE